MGKTNPETLIKFNTVCDKWRESEFDTGGHYSDEYCYFVSVRDKNFITLYRQGAIPHIHHDRFINEFAEFNINSDYMQIVYFLYEHGDESFPRISAEIEDTDIAYISSWISDICDMGLTAVGMETAVIFCETM